MKNTAATNKKPYSVGAAWIAVALIFGAGTGIAIWKARAPNTDWVADHGADMLAAMAGAAAFVFLVRTAILQARQIRSSELLTAFELARPDLETLSRRIATNARLVVVTRKDGRPGKLPKRDLEFSQGDRTTFARLFGRGARIGRALTWPSNDNLRLQVALYVQIFERISALAPDTELREFLLELPLGRAYCALKLAKNEDQDGRLLDFLKRVDPDPSEIDDDSEELEEEGETVAAE